MKIKYAISCHFSGKDHFIRGSRGCYQFGTNVSQLFDTVEAAIESRDRCRDRIIKDIERDIYKIQKYADDGSLHGGQEAADEHRRVHRKTLDELTFTIVKVIFDPSLG